MAEYTDRELELRKVAAGIADEQLESLEHLSVWEIAEEAGLEIDEVEAEYIHELVIGALLTLPDFRLAPGGGA